MKKTLLKLGLTAFALTVGSFLTYARTETCDHMQAGMMVTWEVPAGSNCCSPTSGIGFALMDHMVGGQFRTDVITVQRAQQVAGCPMVYAPH